MIKKIGILNFQYSDHNYGAVLQAAALECYLKELGYEATHIDYVSDPIVNKNSLVTSLKKISKRLGVTDTLKRMLGREVLIKHRVKNEEVFEVFRESWITRTKRFSSFDDLNSTNFEFDAVIVGSDQVWRPTMFTRISDYKVYFLSFIPRTIKKISYAASFGVDYWEIHNEEITSEIKKYIKDFTAISVRESSGVTICDSIFDIDATHVLDPTLLIGVEFFNAIIEKENINMTPQPNVAYYKLDVNDAFLRNIEALGTKKNKKVKNIYYNTVNNNHEYYSVGNWLNNIKSSELIVTDSFHCVCFSILFKKDFLCCINESRGLSRLHSLLGALGLENRICSSDEDFVVKLNSLPPINYVEVDALLVNQRNISNKFLQDNLSTN